MISLEHCATGVGVVLPLLLVYGTVPCSYFAITLAWPLTPSTESVKTLKEKLEILDALDIEVHVVEVEWRHHPATHAQQVRLQGQC